MLSIIKERVIGKETINITTSYKVESLDNNTNDLEENNAGKEVVKSKLDENTIAVHNIISNINNSEQ